MSLEDPVVICCSISGAVANREQCPAIPYTPEDYAAESRRIVDEGGVHIHIHARRPDGTLSYAVADFVGITEAIKAAQANGIGLEEVLDFSRHRDVKIMMIYRDRERNVQGRLSALIAESVSKPPRDSVSVSDNAGKQTENC